MAPGPTGSRPSDGLAAVRGLLDALQDEATRDGLSDAETVVSDLEELARCLEAAAGRRPEFRLDAG